MDRVNPSTRLSAAELRQRREAAQARWAHHPKAGTLVGAAVAGAAIGGVVGGIHRSILTQNQAAAQVRMAGLAAAEQMQRGDEQVQARAAQRGANIDAAVRFRMRVNPETGAERQARLRDLLRGQTTSSLGRRTAPKATLPPVIGSPENLRIYDYEIDQLQRKLRPAEALLNDLRTREQAGEDIPGRTLRGHQVRVDRMKRDIATLQRLKQNAPRATARAGTTRGPAQTPVAGTVENKFRQGETGPQVVRRIRTAKTQLRARHGKLLAQLAQRTEKLRVAQREAALREAESTIREAFQRGRYGQAILRGAGKGALIGAGLGLTSAGIAIIAHHIAQTVGQKRTLAKATSDTPESSIGKGFAETYRAWIDRLLGRTAKPIAMGDHIAAALAPGITQAFADGATQPPQPPKDSDPPKPPGYHIDVDFDQLNPSVRRHMADYALDRIVEISDQQREAIRAVLMAQSVLQGIGPREAARSLRESIGLTAYQTNIVAGYRAELNALDPAALERKLRDKRYDRTVRRAIETNTPLTAEQIDAMVAAYHRRMLALRAETIARTESIRATSYGAVARAQDVLDRHPELDVIKTWIATDDERTRDTHRDLDGKEVTGIQTPFKTSADALIRWPVDEDAPADETINCRCSVGFRFVPKAGLRAEAVAA